MKTKSEVCFTFSFSLLSFSLNRSSHPILKGRKGSFGSFSHSDDDLLVGNRGDISCGIDTRNVRATMCVDSDFSYTVRVDYFPENAAIGH